MSSSHGAADIKTTIKILRVRFTNAHTAFHEKAHFLFGACALKCVRYDNVSA